jgi:flagellar hook-associated protein 2
VASAASETSVASYVNPASTPITTGTTTPDAMQLVVGPKTYNFTLTQNNLNGLVSQINGLGAGVTASVLTTSGGGYLSLTANSTGATTLQLNDTSGATPTNIITSANQGASAEFHLGGIDIVQASNTVNNVISGLTFNIAGKSSTPTTLTLASDSSQLSNDLQTFTANYNAVVAAIGSEAGPGGPLQGNAIVNQLHQALQQVASHNSTTSGSVQSLVGLGMTFNGIDGTLTFDPTVVGGMSSSQLSDAMKFIGSTTTGLAAFSQNFDQLSNPVTGLLQTAISGQTTSDARLQKEIATTTANINAMQKNLAKQIEAADALESSYESQQTELTSSLQGLDLVLYGKALGSPGA